MDNDIDKRIEQLVSESLKLLQDRIDTLEVVFLSTIINVISFSVIILLMN